MRRLTASYLAGGVIRDFTVTVELTNPNDEAFLYTQAFDVMLVALDMSPTTYINNQYASILTAARVKTSYNAATYYGAATNPYKDVYLTHLINAQVMREGQEMNVLNAAVTDLGLEGRSFTYSVTEWDSAIYVNAGTRTQYSKRISVNGSQEYSSNIVYRQWNTSYSITGLDLGYGAGIDSDAYDKKEADGALVAGDSKIFYIVDPLSPGAFTITPKSVTGTYNGADINGFEYTFEAVWWDEASSGSTFSFEGRYLGGGYMDYWKVLVKVYDGADVVYTQVVNIVLVMLDMLPENRTVDNENYEATTSPRSNYGQASYDGTGNPYGDMYAELMPKLNDAAIKKYGVNTKQYTYVVESWQEITVGDVTTVRSEYVLLKDALTGEELNRYECSGFVLTK